MVKNVLLQPTLARRIFKQVEDDDDLYEGQRSTEVINGHCNDTVMSSVIFVLLAQPQDLVFVAFLSSFWQHVFFVYFLISDFDQTWS